MICDVLTLFKTLVDIILFRKGPDALPHSSVLLLLAVAFWIAVGTIGAITVESYDGQTLLVNLLLTAIGLSLYSVVVNVFGKSERLVRALTAILGCGGILSVTLFVGDYILTAILAVEETLLFSELILLWSILIEGHIIARTIDRQMLIGFLIALAVLFVQLLMFAVFKPVLGPAV